MAKAPASGTDGWKEDALDLDAARGFDDAELATCLKVLRALVVAGGGGGEGGDTWRDVTSRGGGEVVPPPSEGGGGEGGDGSHDDGGAAACHVSPLFYHRAHKPLRVALQPLLGGIRAQLFRGGDPRAHRAAKQSKRDRNRRVMMEKAADREAMNNTRMRAERLERLAALEAGHAEVGAPGGLAIGDGGDGMAGGRARGTYVPLVPDGCSGRVSTAIPEPPGAAAPRVERIDGAGDGDDDGEAVDRDDGGEREADAGEATASTASPSGEETLLNIPRQCYVCKRRYRRLHHFYGSLCPECADVNWSKRRQTVDLTGRVAIVTGSRVKIGYRITLKLLRCGAAVVATTRFPVDARRRFENEPDASRWIHRLTVVAMDLRDLPGLERLCAHLNATLPRLDIIVNNACQTVRRPAAYYRHLLQAEAAGARAYLAADDGRSRPTVSSLLAGVGDVAGVAAFDAHHEPGDAARGEPSESTDERAVVTRGWRHGEVGALRDAGWMAPSAAASQLELLPDDATDDATASRHFPAGVLDVNGQQVDLRGKHSWTMKLGEVQTPELLEVLAVNAAAPFVLNGKLRALMERTAALGPVPGSGPAASSGDGGDACEDGARTTALGRAFIVNVSAMEGKFYRYKTANHPHTNMAKAALNMMTATAASDYAAAGIYMNAVDTGWINDENPLETAARVAKDHNFQTPIDEEDAAARCVAPVLEGIAGMVEYGGDGAMPPYGKFFKDYRESEW